MSFLLEAIVYVFLLIDKAGNLEKGNYSENSARLRGRTFRKILICIQAYFGDTVGLVPNHQSKANIAVK